MLPEYSKIHLHKIIPILCIVFFLKGNTLAQNNPTNPQNEYRVMFYNVENLFDTYDDPLTNDDEFTPSGQKNWSEYRYYKKLNDLAKVIIAVGEWHTPDIIGLCEVENFQVLVDLTTRTPLSSLGYEIVHTNSSDQRGIDVALLLKSESVKRLSQQNIRIDTDNKWTTRDILLTKLLLAECDTLHLFVNHWPSRYGGKEQTEDKRKLVAQTLKKSVDSLLDNLSHPKILIMGDFNDEPSDQSLKNIIGATEIEQQLLPDQLYNLSFQDFHAGFGTLVFKEINNTWFLFDQIIISGSLLNGSGLQAKGNKSHIFQADWVKKDEKPYRTYQGPIYKGGFSDHLPIFIDLYYK